jgi:branched-chain amino acid transport system substrate-binding protein
MFSTRLSPFCFLLLLVTIGTLPAVTKPTPAENRLQEPSHLRIGVLISYSGRSLANGIEMAADEVNSSGGVARHPIELIIKNAQGRPDKASEVVSKLIKEDRVDALIGGEESDVTLEAARLAQAAKIPLISSATIDPDVTKVGDYIFRTCFIDPVQGRAMAKFAVGRLKAKRAAILHDSKSLDHPTLAYSFESEFTKLGGVIVSRQTYSAGDIDFRSQLQAIRSAKPQVLYIPGYYTEVGLIARQARDLGVTQPLLGGDGWNSPKLWEIGRQTIDQSYFTDHYSHTEPSPLNQKFVRKYLKRYGVMPDSFAALGYDSLKILADSIARAKTPGSVALRDAIAQTKNFPGLTGAITIDSDRNARKPVVILQVRGRKFILQNHR